MQCMLQPHVWSRGTYVLPVRVGAGSAQGKGGNTYFSPSPSLARAPDAHSQNTYSPRDYHVQMNPQDDTSEVNGRGLRV